MCQLLDCIINYNIKINKYIIKLIIYVFVICMKFDLIKKISKNLIFKKHDNDQLAG